VNKFSVFSWLSIPAAGVCAGLSSIWVGLPLGGVWVSVAAGLGAMAGGAFFIGMGVLLTRRHTWGGTSVLAHEEAGLVAELSVSQRRHYESLRALRDKTLEHYIRLPGGRQLQQNSQKHLNALLAAFLRLLTGLNLYRHCFKLEERRSIEEELKEVQEGLSKGEGSHLVDIKKRRAEILEKRLERFKHAEESREWMSHQLASLEDLLRLTNEQAIGMRDPESVNRQLELLTQQAIATEETVREMERFMEFSEELQHWNTQKAGIRQ